MLAFTNSVLYYAPIIYKNKGKTMDNSAALNAHMIELLQDSKQTRLDEMAELLQHSPVGSCESNAIRRKYKEEIKVIDQELSKLQAP